METLTETNINEIFESVLRDPTLLSTIDIENLLQTIESDKNDYLENMTISKINEIIYNKCIECKLPEQTTQEFCHKLIGYRYVDEIHELHKGKHIRWFRNNSNMARLTNGGIVVDIKFLDNGTHILCMNGRRQFIQYKFDDCISFQKMTVEEQLILMAYEHVNKVT
jgi:hypothetical protein